LQPLVDSFASGPSLATEISTSIKILNVYPDLHTSPIRRRRWSGFTDRVIWHANLTATEVYTRGDPTEKLEAIKAIVPPHLRKGFFRPPDKLIALLKGAP